MRHFKQQQPGSEVVDEDVLLSLALSQQQITLQDSRTNDEVTAFSGWNFVAINAICRASASATSTIKDKRLSPQGGNEPNHRDVRSQADADPDFRWWRLIDQPSPWQTGSQLRWEVVQQMHIHGFSVVWNVKNGFGKTVWRIPLPISLLEPVPPRNRPGMELGGVRVHTIQFAARYYHAASLAGSKIHYASNREIPVDHLTITAYPHPVIRGDGYGPTRAGFGWIDLATQAEIAQAQQYSRGPQKKVLIQPPEGDQINETMSLDGYQKRLDKRVRDNETGVIAIPTGTVQEITIDPDQMAYVDTFQSLGPTIMGLHGTPKAAAGMGENMTYGSLAATLESFGILTVQPDLDLVAAEETATMRCEEGDAYSIVHTAPEYSNPELKETQLQNDLTANTITVGEWRTERGRPLLGDERDNMIVGSPDLLSWKPGQSTTTSIAMPSFGDVAQRAYVSDSGTKDPPECVIAFDLDGTLAAYDGVFNTRKIGEPRQDVVDDVNMLHDAGFGIIIYTARDDDRLVSQWLNASGVKFDAINRNPWTESNDAKVMANVYVDDHAVDAREGGAAILQGIADQLEGTENGDRLRQAMTDSGVTKELPWMFLPVRAEFLELVREVRNAISDEHVTKEVESPHITLLPNVIPMPPAMLAERLQALSRIEVEIGNRFLVLGTGKERAITLPIYGDDIEQLHAAVEGMVTHIASEFHTYTPHVTIAYVKESDASQYDGLKLDFEPATAVASRIVYQHPVDGDLVVPLQ